MRFQTIAAVTLLMLAGISAPFGAAAVISLVSESNGRPSPDSAVAMVNGEAVAPGTAQQASGAAPAPWPEPAALAVFSTGLLAAGMVVRRRRQG